MGSPFRLEMSTGSTFLSPGCSERDAALVGMLQMSFMPPTHECRSMTILLLLVANLSNSL
jgi:hypothetical protein